MNYQLRIAPSNDFFSNELPTDDSTIAEQQLSGQ